jgi:outer membrane protein
MKKTILSILALALFAFTGHAQKFAFVDTDYIMKNIPSYVAAQDKLDKMSKEWQNEVEQMYAEIDEMYKEYQTDKVLMSEDMKRKKEEEIINKEKEVKELQKKYFGPEGELYQKRKELIQPIQDEVYNALEELSTEKRYDAIFDTAAGASMLYTNPQYDISDQVLERLGYKN